MPNSLSLKEFRSIYSRVPRLTVEVVVMTDNGLILTKRNIKPCIGEWHIPGGTLIKNETLQQAIKRVAKTELGIDVIIEYFAGFIEYDQKKYPESGIGLGFIVRPRSKKFKVRLDYQASEYGIFKIVPAKTIREQKIFLKKIISSE